MKRFNKIKDKHIQYIILATVSICFVLTFNYAINHLPRFIQGVRDIFNLFYIPLKPVLIGFIIAFFLYNPVDVFHKFLVNKTKLKSRHARVISTLSIVIVSILIIFLIIQIVLPTTISSISTLSSSVQDNLSSVDTVKNTVTHNNLINKLLSLFHIDISNEAALYNSMTKLFQSIQSYLENLGTYALNLTVSFGKTIYNIFIGIFLAIYMLIDKESLISQVNKVASNVLSEKVYTRLSYVANLMNYMFFKFLSGKAICSIIVGIMSVILGKICGIEYLSLIGFIIAIFNMVPLFGPIFSAIPCALFAFISGGIVKAIIIVIILIIIQQIDQNILAPNIIGDVVELNGFWIIVSIIFMGSLFGVVGMIIGIPAFGVLRIIIKEWLYEKELKKKNKIVKT